MITNISGGDYLTITGSSGTYYNTNSAPLSGTLRYFSGGKVEVFDGQMWHQIHSSTSIGLSFEATEAIKWALSKKREEEYLISLPNDHPAVRSARDNVNRAKQALKEAEEQ